MMNKIFRHVMAAALLCCTTASMAQTYVLQNEYIRAGINDTTGTLGSGGRTNPGLQYDNTGSGTFNPSYDYLTPGSPYEGWAVRIDDTSGTRLSLYGNNNAGFQQSGNTGVTGAWTGTPTASSAVWSGSVTEFDIRHTYSLPSAQRYINITTRIDAKTAMPQLYFGRYIDPDAVAAPGDSSATDNVRGYGIIPRTNVIFSEATVSRYALGLYSAQVGSVNTAILGWSSDPKDYYGGGTSDVRRADDTIGISFYVSNVAVGDILTWNYAYIFGPSAFTAADYAITGGAGGGTPGTSSFGTLVDVGSATSSAGSTSSTPTITGTSTATITMSDTTVISGTLPVITASLAHHVAGESEGKQTIARETTTNVTTPMERTVVTKVRTTSTWSDGTTTYTDSATSSATTVSNSVATTVTNDAFSGRIDQMNKLTNLNKQLNRGLNMDSFRNDGVTDGDTTVYINASGGDSSMKDGYKADHTMFGVSAQKTIDPDWKIGAQYNHIRTTMKGTDSNTSQDKNHAGLYSVYTLEDGARVVNNLGYAEDDVKSNRTVENLFNNNHTTKGKDVWLNNRVYFPDADGFRPFVGITVGRSNVSGYQEAGSVQSQRQVVKQSGDYSYGEVGVRYEKNIDDLRLGGEIGRTTDQMTAASVAIGYTPTKDSVVELAVGSQQGSNINNKTISLRGVIRF